MLQVTLLDGIAGGSQVVERGLHVAGIPGCDDVQQKTQAGCAVELTGKIAIGEHPALSIGDVAGQAMDSLSFIEHTPHLTPMRLVREKREHIHGVQDASVFLQSTMDQVLVIEGLQLAREQDGSDRAIFEGGGNAMHIVPTALNQVPPDGWSPEDRL